MVGSGPWIVTSSISPDTAITVSETGASSASTGVSEGNRVVVVVVALTSERIDRRLALATGRV